MALFNDDGKTVRNKNFQPDTFENVYDHNDVIICDNEKDVSAINPGRPASIVELPDIYNM